jgi:hypothetical protein
MQRDGGYGSIFGLVTLLHLLRLVYGWTVQVGGWVVPEAVSVVATDVP